MLRLLCLSQTGKESRGTFGNRRLENWGNWIKFWKMPLNSNAPIPQLILPHFSFTAPDCSLFSSTGKQPNKKKGAGGTWNAVALCTDGRGGGHVHTQTQLLHQTLHSEHKLRLGGLCFLSGAVSWLYDLGERHASLYLSNLLGSFKSSYRGNS